MSSSGNNNSSRKGKGRQKVDMMKIENETNLQVTFSKRRAGLFKKASELSTLCGAETAVVVFSPGNKAHSFGHPNVDTISERFLNQNAPSAISDADKLLGAHQKATINQQTLELTQLQNQLELEQKRAQELEKVRKEGQRQQWCPPDINKLDYPQLDRLKGALLQFRHKLETKVRNATNFGPPYLPAGPGKREIFQRPNSQGGPSFGNRDRGGKLAIGRPSPRVRFDIGGASGSSDTLVRVDPIRANSPDVWVFDDVTASGNVVTTPYDPMAGETCLTIPYSSTASTPSVDPNEH